MFPKTIITSHIFNGWYSIRKHATIVISGKKLQGTNNTRLEYSTNFFAILYQIKKLDCVESDIHELSEIPIQEPNDVNYSYDDDSDFGDEKEKTSKGMGPHLIVSQSTPFRLNDEIYGYVNISKENDNNEKHPVKTEEFQITLC